MLVPSAFEMELAVEVSNSSIAAITPPLSVGWIL